MWRLIRTVALPFFTACLSMAQQPRGYEQNAHLWMAYFGDHAVSKRWDIHLEGQWRRHNLGLQPQQWFIRTGPNFKLNSHVVLSGFYTYQQSGRYGAVPSNLGRVPEHRWISQLVINHGSKRLAFQHRFRLENRWIGTLQLRDGSATRTGWQYRNRYREWVRVIKSVGQKHYVVAYDEIFLNVAPRVGPNLFDQNRAYIGFGRRLNQYERFDIGYLYQLQPHRSGGIRESNHTISINFFSTRPFRK